jgi:hypothetical protein
VVLKENVSNVIAHYNIIDTPLEKAMIKISLMIIQALYSRAGVFPLAILCLKKDSKLSYFRDSFRKFSIRLR